MTDYKNFDRKIITNFTDSFITDMYSNGYVFGRIEKGQMDQVVSLEIDLENFEFNSENRRIQRKVEWLLCNPKSLPISVEEYDFRIHKIGKDFYEAKNNEKVFSASKIKELIVDQSNSNFNLLFEYTDNLERNIGYAICYENKDIIHYAYPFYDLNINLPNTGMGMIIRAIEYAFSKGIKKFYLGSINSEKNLYKLQFNNSKWWNSKFWETDIEKLKDSIRNGSII